MLNRRPIAVALPTGKEHSVSDAATSKRPSLHKRLSSSSTPLIVRRKKRGGAVAASSSSSSSSSSGSSASSAPESESPEPMALDLSSLRLRSPFPWSPSPPTVATPWTKSPANRHTPISRMPAEILAAIFALDAHHLPDPSKRPTRSHALTLSHVCAQWRYVTHGTSALWANLHMSPATSTDWVAHALALSHTYPLSLTFTAPAAALLHPASRAALDVLASQVAPHLWRVARLAASTDDLHALETLLTPMLDGSAPALRSLVLVKPHEATYDIRAILPPSFLAGPPGLLPACGSTPVLEELVLTCIGLAWHSPVLLGRTGARLTTLDMSHLTGPQLPPLAYEEFRSILVAHPALTTLVLRSTGPMLLPYMTLPEPISLPHLKNLKISALSRGAYVAQLLQLVDTPVLETLELSELDFDGWALFVDSLRAYPLPCSPFPYYAGPFPSARVAGRPKYGRVRQLRLYNSCILADVEPAFFAAFPALEHLTLYCVEADPFVRALQAEAFSAFRPRSARSQAFVIDASAGSRMSVAGSPAAKDAPDGWAPPYVVPAEEAGCIWPYLQTLSLRCAYNETALRATVEARAVIGRPIRTLRLEESLVARLGEGTMRWLKERTTMEEFVYKGY